MAFSAFLDARREDCRKLVAELNKRFAYVSILGTDVASKRVFVNRSNSGVSEAMGAECGFVVKMSNGQSFFEYSTDDIHGDVSVLAQEIVDSVAVDESLSDRMIHSSVIADEPMVRSFSRECDLDQYTDQELLSYASGLKDSLLQKDPKILNAFAQILTLNVSKLFITAHRELDQHYGWANVIAMVLYKDGDKMVQSMDGSYSHLLKEAMEQMPGRLDALVEKARHLATATPITPGIYDVITDPSITGLIAHEAFGHGVEMDQFVKDRALAKSYVGQYVASPICNMHDGAAATLSTASYFFDDDGVLAHDTQIIKDGILVQGISDLTSASELGTEPTGNGRRQSFKRKAYSRMTNTFFEPGKDKLEDMIASIKHGYMLFETNNGMEDPKNWQIQCTAEYGIEIVDGKLTDHYVSPVVMRGYVPDLLKSISMISDDFRVIGMGSCGKGYKEWVRVSDGGPALKARVKLA